MLALRLSSLQNHTETIILYFHDDTFFGTIADHSQKYFQKIENIILKKFNTKCLLL